MLFICMQVYCDSIDDVVSNREVIFIRIILHITFMQYVYFIDLPSVTFGFSFSFLYTVRSDIFFLCLRS